MRTRFKFGSRGLLALSAAAVLASWPAADARAAWVGGASGHSVFTDPNAEADGHVSFAVWEREANSWLDDFTFDASIVAPAGVDGDSKYVYFYQVVNSDPAAGSDTLITLTVPAEGLTSVGYVANWVFQQSDNTRVGADVDGLNSIGTPGVVSDSGASDVVLPGLQAGDAGALFAEFVIDGGYSPLLWFTSSFDPGSVVATLYGETGAYTQNAVASAVPVPASLILVLSGLPMALGFGTVWRRRQQLPLAA